MEFATATFHNSYYFHKGDNVVDNKAEVIENFRLLIERLLKENNPKSWFRAFFNLGLINYINEQPRMLPCQAGTSNFFWSQTVMFSRATGWRKGIGRKAWEIFMTTTHLRIFGIASKLRASEI